ncbi:MAG: DUF4838 domain-containing protein [Thermoguttaceae bacterium]
MVTEGKPTATVVLGANATPPEKFAAEEFVKYVKKASGVVLPIASDETSVSGNLVLVGTAATNSRVAKLKEMTIGGDPNGDAFRLATVENCLVLAGHNGRGVLYAAYAALEEILGIHWPTFDENSEVAPVKNVTVPTLDRDEVPAFRYRGLSLPRRPEIIDWMAKNRLNYVRLSQQYAETSEYRNHVLPELERRGMVVALGAHGFNYFLSPKVYFQDHPEYFALVKGSRKPTQICVSNPEARRIYIANVMRFLEKHPEASLFYPGPEDGMDWCHCEKCAALFDGKWPLKRKMDVYTSSFSFLVNSLAEEVRKRFPDLYVVQSAYVNYLPLPTKAKPASNVVINFAPFERPTFKYSFSCWAPGRKNDRAIDASYLSYFDMDNAMAWFESQIRGWRDLTDGRMLIYEYFDNKSAFVGQTMVCVDAIAADYRYYRGLKLWGVYPQNCWRGRDAYSLNLFAHARLAWNPDQTPEDVRETFCRFCYGSAATPMVKYFRQLENGIVNVQRACNVTGSLSPSRRNQTTELLITPFAGLDDLLKEASVAANTDWARGEVKKQQAVFGYLQGSFKLWHMRYAAERLFDEGKPKEAERMVQSLQEQYKVFLKDMEVLGVRPSRKMATVLSVRGERKEILGF